MGARRAHGGTAKDSAKQLGCPRREPGVTDGAVLRLCFARSQAKKKYEVGKREPWETGQPDYRETVWGSQSRRQRPQLRSGSLAGRLADQRLRHRHTRQYPYPWSIMHTTAFDLHAVACPRMPRLHVLPNSWYIVVCSCAEWTIAYFLFFYCRDTNYVS